MRRCAWTSRATIRLLIFLAMAGAICYLLWGCGGDDGNGGGTPPPPTNQLPLAYMPFVASADYSVGGRVVLDLRYRTHGCDAGGNPTSVTGAWDPDGDPLEYRITCKWSVFDVEDRRVNGEWVTFRKDDRGEQEAVLQLWIGWQEDAPKHPISPVSCGPGPLPPEPLVYEVRDGKGGMAGYQIVLGPS